MRRLLAHPRLPTFVALVAVVLGLPSLGGGFLVDDYAHRAHLDGSWPVPGGSPLMTLFEFVPGEPARRQLLLDLGVLPWWSDPELHLALWRPVTAATHLLDFALWPGSPALQHLHSLLWWGLAAWGVARLYRELLGPGAAAGLAALLFVVEDAHAVPVLWLANRNALLALAFGILAVHLHVRWRRTGRAAALAGSLGAFGLGLLSAEIGLGALAYLVAWQLTLDKARGLRRWTPLLPAVGVVGVWRLVYRALGYGAHGSGLYLDPLGSPRAFLSAVVTRAPILTLGQWTQAPVDAFVALPAGARLGLTLLGIGAIAGVAFWLRGLLTARPEARFLAVGSLFSLVPVCATFPMLRLLMFSGVGALGLLALQAERVGLLDGERRPGRRAALAMLVLHGPLAALLLVGQVAALPRVMSEVQVRLRALGDDPALAGQTLVQVNGPGLALAYVKIGREPGDLVPRRVALLGPLSTALHVAREGASTLVVRPEGGFLASLDDQLVRSLDRPFTPGERIPCPDFTVEILSVTDDGRPAAARFQFKAPLEDPRYRFVSWRDGHMVPFSLAIGEERLLPPLQLGTR